MNKTLIVAISISMFLLLAVVASATNLPQPLTVGIPAPAMQSLIQGQTGSVVDAGARGGSGNYTYQWLAEAPSQSVFSASEGTSLCGASATSIVCNLTTSTSTATGNYKLELQATDTVYNISANSTSVSLAVQSVPTGSITTVTPTNTTNNSATPTTTISGGAFAAPAALPIGVGVVLAVIIGYIAVRDIRRRRKHR